MPFLKNITQRLFGRTVIDSLDLNQNAWYIDEEQVTVTAANLNGTSVLPATSSTVDLTNDDILYLDHSASHIIGYDSIPDFMTLVAGTVGNSGLTATSGVLKIDPHNVTAETIASGDILLFSDEGTAGDPLRATTIDNYATFLAGTAANTALAASAGVLTVTPSEAAMTVSTDALMYVTAAGVPKKNVLTDILANVAGNGIFHAAGVLSTEYAGAPAVGSVRFTGVGDCDAVQVGAVLYTRDGTPDPALGEWTEGVSANESATNLAAGINGDTRNGGTTYYTAVANTDTVHIFDKSVNGNAAIALTGGAPTEPSVLENLVGGLPVATSRIVTLSRTVTANDVQTAVLVHIPLPFVPRFFIAEIRNSTGGVRHDVTDQFTIGATPNRIVLTDNGATHVIAGDVITIYAQE
jgi:hypothetical protein